MIATLIKWLLKSSAHHTQIYLLLTIIHLKSFNTLHDINYRKNQIEEDKSECNFIVECVSQLYSFQVCLTLTNYFKLRYFNRLTEWNDWTTKDDSILT